MKSFLDALKTFEMKYNTPPDLIKFFSTPDRPVSRIEFLTFWHSLADEEKEYYRYAKI